MLSRIAESLYWIGRYVERAEDTSRLLEVYLQLLVEDPSVDTHLSTVTLFAVLGMEPPAGPVSSQEVLRTIQNHPTAACSILASLGGGRESARRARETVPRKCGRASTPPGTASAPTSCGVGVRWRRWRSSGIGAS